MLRISSGDEKKIDVSNKVSVNIVTEIQHLFSNYQFSTSPPSAQQRTRFMKGLYLKEFLTGKFPPGTWHSTKVGAKIQRIFFIL